MTHERLKDTLVTTVREVHMAADDETQLIGRARRVPELKPGRYSDGLPLHEVKYLECKLILKPNPFTSGRAC